MSHFKAAILLTFLLIPVFGQQQPAPTPSATVGAAQPTPAQPTPAQPVPTQPVVIQLKQPDIDAYERINQEWQRRQSDRIFSQEALANLQSEARIAKTDAQYKELGRRLAEAIRFSDLVTQGIATAEKQYRDWDAAVRKAYGCEDCTVDTNGQNRRLVKQAAPTAK